MIPRSIGLKRCGFVKSSFHLSRRQRGKRSARRSAFVSPRLHSRVEVLGVGSLDLGLDVLQLECDKRVVHVAVSVQASESLEGLLVSSLEGEPARRLGKGTVKEPLSLGIS